MIDLSTLKKITRGDEALITQFLTVFITSTTKDLNKLQAAIDSNQKEKVFFFVHKLKSSTLSIGVREVHEELMRLENMLMAETPIQPIHEDLNAVTEQCKKVVIEAKKLLEEG